MLTKVQTTETIGEAVYRQIRSDIIFGVLAPGQKLRLERASERYGTSIPTLRELLTRMCAEGLVCAEGQRGFEVAPVSAEDFRQLAELRLLLENHALEKSFAAGDLDWEGRVVAAHHKLAVMEKRMLEQRDHDQKLWKQCDWDFHHALISACGSNVLLTAHAAAYDRYLRYQMIAVVFRGEIAAREHQALLDAALVRDWKRAQTDMATHIRDCVEHALKENRAGIFDVALKQAAANQTRMTENPVVDKKASSRSAKSAGVSRRSVK